MTKSKKPENIGDLLKGLFHKRNWQERFGMHALFSFWDEAIGDEIALHAQPDLIRGSVLWLRVSDSIWMQQLHLSKNLLMETINARLGDSKITDIRFRIDPTLGQPKPQPEPPTPPQPIDQERLKKAEAMFADLPGKELQSTLRRLWIKTETHRSKTGNN
ncbi:MAG: DUF721 domain-containing protein [Desulfobulbaceae bacterium]|nr:DUF721 domain-containing protein [Desulfobulbaceae bacterium]